MSSRDDHRVVVALDEIHSSGVVSRRESAGSVPGTGVAGVKVISCRPEEYATRRLLSQVTRDSAGAETFGRVLDRLRLPADDLHELRATVQPLDVIVAPYDIGSVNDLDREGGVTLQIDPACNTHLSLIRRIAEVADRVYYCTWGSTVQEIEQGLELLHHVDVVLMHALCRTPSTVLLRDLAALRWLQSLGRPVGCRVEAETFLAGLALTLGAEVIEQSICWIGEGPQALQDHLTKLVRELSNLEKVRDSGPRGIYGPADLDAMDDQRAGLVAACDISRGTRLSADMVSLKAPALGLSPSLLPFVLGREVLYDLREDEPVTFGMLGT